MLIKNVSLDDFEKRLKKLVFDSEVIKLKQMKECFAGETNLETIVNDKDCLDWRLLLSILSQNCSFVTLDSVSNIKSRNPFSSALYKDSQASSTMFLSSGIMMIAVSILLPSYTLYS